MTNPTSDRNLLAGIIAVQMDLISSDRLVAAMHAWVADKSKSLEEILVAQDAIDAETASLAIWIGGQASSTA